VLAAAVSPQQPQKRRLPGTPLRPVAASDGYNAGIHKELRMSLINGDKSRDNRRHKKVMKMREKREALKAKLAGTPQKKAKA